MFANMHISWKRLYLREMKSTSEPAKNLQKRRSGNFMVMLILAEHSKYDRRVLIICKIAQEEVENLQINKASNDFPVYL